MIKKGNVAVSLNSGKVGNVRYYTKAGKTYTRVASSDVQNPRSKAQMAVRCRIANIKAMFSNLSVYLKKCFEKADASVSIYALFSGRAAKCAPVYLSKEEKQKGYCIAAPYCISEGSLPTIQYAMNSNGVLESNIELGALTITAATTVGELADAIIANNPSFAYGDYITFFDIEQTESMGVPSVKVDVKNLCLVKNSAELIEDKVNDGFASTGGHLAMQNTPENGVYGWVHSRKGNGVQVSTQYLYDCNSLMIAEYGSDEQLDKARYSYGESVADPFITSDKEEENRPAGYYKLTVMSESDAKGTVTGGGFFEEGADVTVSAFPKSGYQFEGWYRDGEKFSSDATANLDMPAADITVLAKFRQVGGAHTITLTAGSNGQVKVGDGAPGATATGSVEDGGSIQISAIANSGFIFQKWSDNNMQNPRTLSDVTEDIELTATFQSED